MRQLLWTIALAATSVVAYGQRTEFSVQAGSGLFSFQGPGLTNETSFVLSDVATYPNVLHNPYGRSSGLSYSVTGQLQRVTKHRFIYGVQAAYESLTSKVLITYVGGELPPNSSGSGQATLSNRFINLNPFAGKRFHSGQIYLDVAVGVDLGLGLASRERSAVTLNSGFTAATNTNRPIPAVDLRPRLNLTGYYQAFGLSVGYSHGITNYSANQFGNRPEVYSRLWRVGVAYRLGKPV